MNYPEQRLLLTQPLQRTDVANVAANPTHETSYGKMGSSNLQRRVLQR